ncbi:pyrimidine reductase family protein [Corynebacterium sp. CCM 9203]|uniref:pyrimidine reductase family protein n=1 Tax=Corynebacterium sp. CCM 9203 TaxID=3057615 RepID=UPI0035251657
MIPLSDFLEPEPLIGPIADPHQDQVRALSAMTLTGATAIGGSSRAIGNATDTELLLALRRWSDVVLVGAETVRSENYGGVVVDTDTRLRRAKEGRGEVPPLAVVSRSLALSPDSRLFADTCIPPLILTPESSYTDPALTDSREMIRGTGAQIFSIGDGDARKIMETLRRLGHRRILCEGGACLLGQLVRAGLTDIHHVTIDPSLTLPAAPPLISSPPEDLGGEPEQHQLELADMQATKDGCVFLRYHTRHPGPTP